MQESLTGLEAGGKAAEREKGAATAGAWAISADPPRPGRSETAEKRSQSPEQPTGNSTKATFIIADAAARYFRENGITKLPASKALQAGLKAAYQRRTPDITITGQNGRIQAAYRQSDAISTRFYAGNASQQKSVNRNDKNHPKMIPNPLQKRRYAPYPTRNTPRFLTGLQGRKKARKMIPR